MSDRPNYIMGALAGGAVMGIMTGLPCVQICCILWAPLGGLLAAFVASRRPTIFGIKEGLVASLLASLFALPFNAIITVPLQLLFAAMMKAQGGGQAFQNPMLNDPNMPPWAKDFAEQMGQPGSPTAIIATTLCYGLGPALFLGWIGGLLGGILFKKEEGGPADNEQVAEVFQ